MGPMPRRRTLACLGSIGRGVRASRFDLDLLVVSSMGIGCVRVGI